jgi:hypothetical protein
VVQSSNVDEGIIQRTPEVSYEKGFSGRFNWVSMSYFMTQAQAFTIIQISGNDDYQMVLGIRRIASLR